MTGGTGEKMSDLALIALTIIYTVFVAELLLLERDKGICFLRLAVRRPLFFLSHLLAVLMDLFLLYISIYAAA